jgi:hypothetical protein
MSTKMKVYRHLCYRLAEGDLLSSCEEVPHAFFIWLGKSFKRETMCNNVLREETGKISKKVWDHAVVTILFPQ